MLRKSPALNVLASIFKNLEYFKSYKILFKILLSSLLMTVPSSVSVKAIKQIIKENKDIKEKN